IAQTDLAYIQYAETCRLMDNLLPSEKVRHDGDFLSAAILAFGKVHQKITPQTRYWVEKTPYNEYLTEQIFGWWPDARCIHVVRDPRDNYATYRRKHPNLPAERFSRSWSTSLKAGFQCQKQYGAKRYWILKYEDLTQNPDQVIPELARFLDIEDHESLRTPTKNGVLWQGNSIFNERFSGISSHPLGRWKNELKPTDVAVIETACQAGMKHMGYLPQSGFSLPAYGRLLRFYALMTMRLPSDLLQTVRRHYGVMPQ
ncbi:MAG: sulfotransferase, partial [Anaerolineales bacterium]